MHPTDRNFLKLNISNALYVAGETCYYEIIVPNAALDRLNYRYFWDVEIKEQTNCNIYISDGRSLDTASGTKEVDIATGYRFQYEAEARNVYLAFSATEDQSGDGKDPAFEAYVYLRSFLVGEASSTSISTTSGASN